MEDVEREATLNASGLRGKWMDYLEETKTPLSCDQVRALLQRDGLVALGSDKKSQIRNIYGAANSHPQIRKVAPGLFSKL